MGEPHVIAALRAKRAEVSGYVHDLERRIRHQRAQLANIDATIRLFFPEADPEAIPPKRPYRRARYFSHGQLPRECLDVLRGQAKPLTTFAIVDTIMERSGLPTDDITLRTNIADRLLNILRKFKVAGTVTKTGTGRSCQWMIGN